MRIFILGFLFGFLGTFIATLGLAIRFVEVIAVPFLFPIRAVSQFLPTEFFPGFLSVVIFALLNGIFYAGIFGVLGTLLRSK